MRYLLAVAIVLSLAVQSPVQAQASFDTKAVLASIDARAPRPTATSRCRSGSSPRSATRSRRAARCSRSSSGRRVHGEGRRGRDSDGVHRRMGQRQAGDRHRRRVRRAARAVAGGRARAARGRAAEGAGTRLRSPPVRHGLDGGGDCRQGMARGEQATPGRCAFTARRPRKAAPGKVYMLRAGLFDDVDTVVTMHPGDRNAPAPRANLANITGKFRFRGRVGARVRARRIAGARRSMRSRR